MEIRWDNTVISFDIIYSNRKSIGIHLDENGNVTVRAPRRIKYNTIEEIVLEKANWINKKKKELKIKKNNIKSKKFVDGELFLYMGKEFPLKVIVNTQIKEIEVMFKGDFITVRTPVVDYYKLRNAMELWYRNISKDIILKSVKHYESKFSKEVNRIVIKEQKSRWGSCSSKNNLNFNWRLSMAPPEVIEYIVVHEMCHLEHMNHSKEFWTLVEYFISDYKKYREWLKLNGRHLYTF